MIFADDLSKKFGNEWAVDGVQFDVQPGQILALIGQNGAGKTTTVRMLVSILQPTRGRASIAGYDVISQPEMVRSVVGVLTEQHGSYLRMTGKEYLDFFGKLYRLDPARRRKRTEELLGYFDLQNVSGKRIGEYSKGMRQKIALARALIHDPPVYLLDEPTSAMDPESANLVRKSIAKMRSEKKTIILCTHNLGEAELLADHVAIISKGRILIDGSVAGIKGKIFGPKIFEMICREPCPPNFGTNIGAEFKIIDRHTVHFQVSDPESQIPVLLRKSIQSGLNILQVKEITHTLEDAYLEIMRQCDD